MCLKLNKNFKKRDDARAFIKKKPFRTLRAIKVYKILQVSEEGELEFTSLCRGTPYKSGEEKKVSKFSFQCKDIAGTWRIAINKGLHSYKAKDIAISIVSQSKGKHVYAIVECIIPKGTPYYKNDFEYVSLQLNLPILSFKVNEKKSIMTPNNEWGFHSNIKGADLEITLPN